MKIKNASAFLYVVLFVSWASFLYAQQVAPAPDLWLALNGNYNDFGTSTASPPHDVYGVLNTTFTNNVPNANLGTSSLFVPGNDSYVEADYVSDLDFNTGSPFSVSAWINTITTNGGVIWAKSTAAADSGGDEHTIACFVGAGDTVDNGDAEPVGTVVVDVFNVGNLVSKTKVNDGNWHHVVVTYSAASLWSLYIDGVPQTTGGFQAANEGTNDEGPWSFTIGATLNAYFPLETGTYDPWTGDIDQVGVWNCALTPNQVTSVYTSGIPFQTINITQQPVSTNVPLNSIAIFSAAGAPVNISGSLGYQWVSNGVPIVGATSANYTTPPLTNTTVYACLLTVGSVTVSTEPAVATVLFSAPPQGNTLNFRDNYSNGSTVNSATPSPPTATSTSYEQISSKTWSPNPPTITPGQLQFGNVKGTSEGNEIQALFTTAPVTLQNPGDFVQLTVTFTDSNILSSDTCLGMGLFDANQVAPWGGGLNALSLNTKTTAVTGGAQNWQGYIAQFNYLGGTMKTQFASRPAQNNGNNVNQVTEVNGSANTGYQDATILSQTTNAAVALTQGGQYAEVLTYVLEDDGSLQMEAMLYTNNVSGTQLSFQWANSGAPALATTFDAFSIGWRSKDNSNPTIINVNSVQITSMVAPTAAPTAIPLQLETVSTNLTLTWTNPVFSLSFSTNVAGPYVTIPGASSPFVTNTSGGTGFFRLVAP